MERPASVSVIAGLFFLVAAYLAAIGAIDLVAPDWFASSFASSFAASALSSTFYGRELDAPQTAISVGLGWALVGWGLLQLRNWARWCAIAILVLGIAGSVPAVSAASRGFGWRFAWEGSQLMLRVVVVWYLAQSPEISEAFRGKTPSNW